jgi:CDP-diacylglycerol--glycerol-3-phosphate 3-phosphatidyltransferase
VSPSNRACRYLPNAVSTARILLAAPIVLAIRSGATHAAALLLLTAAATDALDGWLARRLGAESAAGRALDPLADKLLAAAAAFALWRWGDLPGWFLLAVVARDLLILAGGVLVARARGEIPVSNRAGKIAFALLAAVFFVYAIRARSLFLVSLVAGSLALLVSLASYAHELAAARSRQAADRENP